MGRLGVRRRCTTAPLRPGHRRRGPAIVAQYDSTTLILRGHVGVVDAHAILLTRPRRRMTDVDPTLDLIENALKNARFEMDEVVRRAAMSPTIREQHDEFPMIANGAAR